MGYWSNTLKTTILLALLTGLLLLIGNLIGGSTGVVIAFFFVLIFNGLMYWFSDKIVLKMYGAKPLAKDHKVTKMVENLARKANLPMPKVYIVHENYANAFATGRDPEHSAVAVTQGILNILDDKELEGVLAHEVSHIKNRDTLVTTIAGVIAGVIAYIADILMWTSIFGGGDEDSGVGNIFSLLAIIILAPLISIMIQMAISRSREYLADESGSHLLKNSKGLASGLRKLEMSAKQSHVKTNNSHAATSSLFIVNPFRGSFIFEMFSTHPPMDKRIKKLEEMKF